MLAQVEKNGTAVFIHQDASHDVVSLTNVGGAVVRQIVYSAAGTPLIVDDLLSHPPCKVGSNDSLYFLNQVFSRMGQGAESARGGLFLGDSCRAAECSARNPNRCCWPAVRLEVVKYTQPGPGLRSEPATRGRSWARSALALGFERRWQIQQTLRNSSSITAQSPTHVSPPAPNP